MSKKLEFVIVHAVIVLSVLGMSWGPLIYIMRTVQMHQGGAL